ncbi:MAG: STAS domain-containing protein [bacterium]|nr:STAS domain-containing protein [candidate division KSB1 bacterium]MDH7561247.1 STAS domain-containing protein [bacterium]
MEVRVRQEGGADIVEVAGEVDLFSSPEVRKALLSLAKKRSPLIIVDLARVSYMDSSGLATLIEGLQMARAHQGEFKLASLREEVLEVFELTRLVDVFEIHDDVAQALASLRPGGDGRG